MTAALLEQVTHTHTHTHAHIHTPFHTIFFPYSFCFISCIFFTKANLKKEKYPVGGTLVGPWKQYVVLFRSQEEFNTFSDELKRYLLGVANIILEETWMRRGRRRG
jgi:hypothetical protein